jgi:hypothetical protein
MKTNARLDSPDHGVAARFGLLKQQLLLERLNQTPESELHALIMRQANEAAFLAWLSAYPLLAFPCLFEERAAAAAEQARRQAHQFWDSLEVEARAYAA